jgi:cAMP-binding proteins - catabolite gene activator and regulatory subunit of cAMP-dependent protein kinases
MDYSVLEKSTLFSGVPTKELRDDLEAVPHHIQCYDKDETVFHLMEDANRIGVILEGRAQAQKPFPNGSQVNVSVRNPGEMIGPAAVFSRSQKYPCDVVSLEPSTIMMFRREDILLLLQKDLRIMKNFMAELATATYMLQQRLELLSYSGIAQKAAFYLLIQARQSGNNAIRIPESVSNWAMIMNVSRSSLHRELKKLEVDGIISYDPPTIKIHDPEALQNVLSK